MYVFIATIQIVIIIYIFLFFNLMKTSQEQNLSTQIDNNSLSGEMVAFVLLTFIIMIFDRILYSTHQFISNQQQNKVVPKTDVKSNRKNISTLNTATE